MSTVRILVANEGMAAQFESQAPGEPLIALSRIPFEEGRRRPSEVDTDRPGAAVNPNTGQSHSVGRHHTPREQAAIRFAKLLCDELYRDLRAGEFDELILVAPPRLLGTLRKAMDKHLAARVRACIDKDLPDPEAGALGLRLANELKRPRHLSAQ